MYKKRVYDALIEQHLKNYNQMVFVSGPRQCGKTTMAKTFSEHYLNWDVTAHRALLLKGEEAIAAFAQGAVAKKGKRILVLDELHHFRFFKRLLKGLYDGYGDRFHFIVTGSARLDVVRKAGDSLMGRYFSYHVHPFSVAELLRQNLSSCLIQQPQKPKDSDWDKLLTFGGFPDPFLKADLAFWRRWKKLRFEQLVREDIRNDTGIRQLAQIETLAYVLAERSGEQINYAGLAKELQATEVTVKTWVNKLASFYFGFTLSPWSQSISNAIRKMPKWYLRDWSGIAEKGKLYETFVACHLLKAVDYWNDSGIGDFALYYVRTKQGEEVDFLITQNGKPWTLIEVKSREMSLSKTLVKMHEHLKTEHAFQVVMELPFEDVDCFGYRRPLVVSGKTLLSQLI